MRERLELCHTTRTPHPGHAETIESVTVVCPGRPEPDSLQGRAWAAIEDAVMDALHGDTSGLDDGIAVALARLAEQGLLPQRVSTFEDYRRVETVRCRRGGETPCTRMAVFEVVGRVPGDWPSGPLHAAGWTKVLVETATRWGSSQEWACRDHR